MSSVLGMKATLARGIKGRKKVFVVGGTDVETVRRKLNV